MRTCRRQPIVRCAACGCLHIRIASVNRVPPIIFLMLMHARLVEPHSRTVFNVFAHRLRTFSL